MQLHILEDVWVDIALNDIEEAKRKIDNVPKKHPFELRYNENIGKINWEACSKVLESEEIKKHLLKKW